VAARIPARPPRRIMRRMTYAVLWCENDGPEFAGGLLLAGRGLELTGTSEGRPAAQRAVPYDDVRDVYLERAAPRRHTWDPSLVLVTRDGDRVEIGSLQGLGALHELADRVAHARGKAAV
jgi:hypothetical protein